MAVLEMTMSHESEELRRRVGENAVKHLDIIDDEFLDACLALNESAQALASLLRDHGQSERRVVANVAGVAIAAAIADE